MVRAVGESGRKVLIISNYFLSSFNLQIQITPLLGLSLTVLYAYNKIFPIPIFKPTHIYLILKKTKK